MLLTHHQSPVPPRTIQKPSITMKRRVVPKHQGASNEGHELAYLVASAPMLLAMSDATPSVWKRSERL
jgi:hypothetical protein